MNLSELFYKVVHLMLILFFLNILCNKSIKIYHIIGTCYYKLY